MRKLWNKLKWYWYLLNQPLDLGFATQKKWPGKYQWGFYHTYYDGHYCGLHIGPFYACMAY